MAQPDFPGKENVGHPDLSPAETTIAFDPILPLLRVPVPAGDGDDPSKGAYVLAFKDETSWRQAMHACEQQLTEQCEAGARMGCSVSAAKACRPPWWKLIFSFRIKDEDREACEENMMMGCLAAAKEDCSMFGKNTCEPVFAEMRISGGMQFIDSRFSNVNPQRKRLSKNPVDIPASPRWSPHEATTATNYRGRKIMGDKKGFEGDKITKAEYGRKLKEDGWVGGLIKPKIETEAKLMETNESISVEPSLWQELWKQTLARIETFKVFPNFKP